MFRLKLFFVVVLLLEIKNSVGEELRVQNHDGFGYELIQSRVDLLESRFSERFDQLKKQVEVFQQQLNGNVERKISQLEKGIGTSIGNKVAQISDQISNLQNSFSERYEQLKKQVGQVEVAQNQLNSNVDQKITHLEKKIESSLVNKFSQITDQIMKLQTISLNHGPLQDRLSNLVGCSELPKATPGSCSMVIGGNMTVVYRVHRFNVSWLTVLQRYDGSEDFHRIWTDYRDGFGTAGKEFWLGLERLHVLTKNDSYELAVEVEDFSGNYKYARYHSFSIGSEEDLYRLNVLGGYSGTAGDSFTFHKGSQFSTLDKGPNTSCANSYTGGWWYNSCYISHLTGKWQRTNGTKSITWVPIGTVEYTALKFVRMLIRRI